MKFNNKEEKELLISEANLLLEEKNRKQFVDKYHIMINKLVEYNNRDYTAKIEALLKDDNIEFKIASFDGITIENYDKSMEIFNLILKLFSKYIEEK